MLPNQCDIFNDFQCSNLYWWKKKIKMVAYCGWVLNGGKSQVSVYIHLFTNFHSDIPSQIFYMNYQEQIWTDPAGVVERRNYGNGESMSGIIAPTGAFSIRLQFTFFNTELGYDFVTIKSCTAIDCFQNSLLSSNSGSTVPAPVTSDTGVMMIQWRSDASVTYSGWAATWSSVLIGIFVYIEWMWFHLV